MSEIGDDIDAGGTTTTPTTTETTHSSPTIDDPTRPTATQFKTEDDLEAVLERLTSIEGKIGVQMELKSDISEIETHMQDLKLTQEQLSQTLVKLTTIQQNAVESTLNEETSSSVKTDPSEFGRILRELLDRPYLIFYSISVGLFLIALAISSIGVAVLGAALMIVVALHYATD